MAVNVEKMRAAQEKRAEESKDGGQTIKIEEGETLVYIHPVSEGHDLLDITEDLTFIQWEQVYDIGPGADQGVTLLDRTRNPLLDHPTVREACQAKKKRPFDPGEVESDPYLAGVESGDVKKGRESARFMWGATMLGHRVSASKPMEMVKNPQPGLLPLSGTAHDQLLAAMLEVAAEADLDPTDPDQAVYFRINRKGSGARNTRYTVTADSVTMRKPAQLSPELQAAVEEARGLEGDANLYRVFALWLKSPEQVQAILDGVELEDEEDEKPKAAKKTASKPAAPAKPAGKPAAAAPKPAASTKPAAAPAKPTTPAKPAAATTKPAAKPAAAAPAKAPPKKVTPPPPPEPEETYVDDEGWPCDAEGNHFLDDAGNHLNEEGQLIELVTNDDGEVVVQVIEAVEGEGEEAAEEAADDDGEVVDDAEVADEDAGLDEIEAEIEKLTAKKVAGKPAAKPSAPAKPAGKPAAAAPKPAARTAAPAARPAARK